MLHTERCSYASTNFDIRTAENSPCRQLKMTLQLSRTTTMIDRLTPLTWTQRNALVERSLVPDAQYTFRIFPHPWCDAHLSHGHTLNRGNNCECVSEDTHCLRCSTAKNGVLLSVHNDGFSVTHGGGDQDVIYQPDCWTVYRYALSFIRREAGALIDLATPVLLTFPGTYIARKGLRGTCAACPLQEYRKLLYTCVLVHTCCLYIRY